jgi:hypothetical protein
MFHFSLFRIKSFLGGNMAILLNSIARGYNPFAVINKENILYNKDY